MKSLNSFAFASLSFVAVAGIQADEPVKSQAQQSVQNHVVSRVESGRHHRRQVISLQSQAIQSSSAQLQNPAPAAQPANNAPASVALQPEQRRRGLLSRLQGGRSRSSSAISISQATAPAPAGSPSQPLPIAK